MKKWSLVLTFKFLALVMMGCMNHPASPAKPSAAIQAKAVTQDCSALPACANGQQRNTAQYAKCECLPQPVCPKVCTFSNPSLENSCTNHPEYAQQTVNGLPCTYQWDNYPKDGPN